MTTLHASIQGYLKLTLIVCILATFNPFPFMGVDTPSAFAWALDNKMYACMMLFFICNAVESQVSAERRRAHNRVARFFSVQRTK
jgi:hypothetical protein